MEMLRLSMHKDDVFPRQYKTSPEHSQNSEMEVMRYE